MQKGNALILALIQEIFCYISKFASSLLELQWLVQSLKEPRFGFEPSTELIASSYLKLITDLNVFHFTFISL